MSEINPQALQQALFGDLRPQFNPASPAAFARLSADWKALEPALIDRLFRFARPIADASTGPGTGLRLHDSGGFFYLVETLRRLGYRRLEEMLQIVLDEFARLTESSYDELYLWSLVELSRTDLRHVGTFWPQAITLDLRYRAAPWRRPAGTRVYDQPYRLTDLLFYFYVLYTLVPRGEAPGNRFPSLARCLKEIAGAWSGPERRLAAAALRELREEDSPHRKAIYSDALGLLRG